MADPADHHAKFQEAKEAWLQRSKNAVTQLVGATAATAAAAAARRPSQSERDSKIAVTVSGLAKLQDSLQAQDTATPPAPSPVEPTSSPSEPRLPSERIHELEHQVEKYRRKLGKAQTTIQKLMAMINEYKAAVEDDTRLLHDELDQVHAENKRLQQQNEQLVEAFNQELESALAEADRERNKQNREHLGNLELLLQEFTLIENANTDLSTRLEAEETARRTLQAEYDALTAAYTALQQSKGPLSLPPMSPSIDRPISGGKDDEPTMAALRIRNAALSQELDRHKAMLARVDALAGQIKQISSELDKPADAASAVVAEPSRPFAVSIDSGGGGGFLRPSGGGLAREPSAVDMLRAHLQREASTSRPPPPPRLPQLTRESSPTYRNLAEQIKDFKGRMDVPTIAVQGAADQTSASFPRRFSTVHAVESPDVAARAPPRSPGSYKPATSSSREDNPTSSSDPLQSRALMQRRPTLPLELSVQIQAVAHRLEEVLQVDKSSSGPPGAQPH